MKDEHTKRTLKDIQPPQERRDKPFKRSRKDRNMREEEDDKGSVQDCYVCGLAYFSRWETDKPFSPDKLTPDPEDLECDKCMTERLFLRNMKLLKEQREG